MGDQEGVKGIKFDKRPLEGTNPVVERVELWEHKQHDSLMILKSYRNPVSTSPVVQELEGVGGALECQGGIRLVQKFT